MSAIDKQEKLTFEGSHSSEMRPARTHFLTFCLCLITEKGHSGSMNCRLVWQTRGESRNCKTAISLSFLQATIWDQWNVCSGNCENL